MAALVVLATACADPPPSKYPTQEVAIADTTLGPGDIFDVRVYRQEELTGTYEVAPDCNVAFPLIGLIKVCGNTPPAIGEAIKTGLADGYLKNPQVSVLVKEYRSKKISVFGQVKKPGTLPYSAGMTVVEAISQAGGFNEMARKNATTVTRTIGGGKTRYTIPVESIGEGHADNFIVRPGDVVFVPRRSW